MNNRTLKLPERIKQRTGRGFLSPTILVDETDITSGQTVLELGRPVGFFAPIILQILSGNGRLYVGGSNTESFEKLNHLNQQYTNFEQILLSEILQDKLEDGSVDTVIFTNLFSNTKYIHHFCSSLSKFMKPGGELIVFDWDPRHPQVGADLRNRHNQEQIIGLLSQYGLSLSRRLNAVGYHFGLVFRFG
jgi:SAM-dependent methyltransferase